MTTYEEDSWIDILTISNIERPSKGKWNLSEKDVQKLPKWGEEISKKRGRVLSSSLLIEGLLEVMITDVFFNKDIRKLTKEKRLFEGAILEREFFTFMSKWRVFRELCHNHPSLNIKNRSDLLTELKEVINIRNRFAHGKVIFKEGKNPTLIYYEDGKKERLLDDSYFNETRDKFTQLYGKMWKVLTFEIRGYSSKNSA